MSRAIFRTAIAVACVLALTTVPAAAAGRERSATVVDLVPSGDASAACPDALFGIAFDVTSLAGRPLGQGRSCVASIQGCDPFAPNCRQTVRATFTLDLPRGSLTAPMTLRELWPSETSFVQVGHGTITAGTGDYKGVTGHIDGGGAGSFTEQGFEGRLLYLIRLGHGS
jgi:hypothetical protein